MKKKDYLPQRRKGRKDKGKKDFSEISLPGAHGARNV
jgi:hypothetical protein